MSEIFGNLSVVCIELGEVRTNCYIISNSETKEAVLVDPGDLPNRIIEYINREQLKPVAILLTHGHFDHIFAVRELMSTFSIPVYAHEAEKELLEDSNLNLSIAFGSNYGISPDELLKDKQNLVLLGEKVKVIHTPGHTKGGVCYYFEKEKIMFCGDTIFLESVGRTDFPGGNQKELLESIHEKLLPLGDEIRLYPGHGPATTIHHERKFNPFITGQMY